MGCNAKRGKRRRCNRAEESTEETSDLADLEWEGVTFKAPTKVKEALMRQADYTRKTQEVADERRTLEHAKAVAQSAALEKVFVESITQEQQELAVIDAYLQQAGKMDWASMSADQMLRAKIEIDGIKERRGALKDAIEGKRAKFQEDMKARITELRGKSREEASKRIRGFTEETEGAMRKFAQSKGLSDTEIDNVFMDPRSMHIVWMASQFESIQANTKTAAERATKATPTLKPGVASERMPAKTADQLNFRKAMKSANSSGDKARVIEDRLSRVFTR